VLSAESIAVIKVIPRIDSEKLPTCPSPLSREAANSISKDITGRKRKRRNRPAAKLFNPHEWPKEHVKEISVGTAEAHNFLDSSVGLGQYKYRGYLYTNGLLEREVPLCSVVFDPTTPTWDELQSWSGCADHHIRRYAMNQLVHFTAKLWEQDRVQVTAGDYQGREGKVQRVEKEEVIILLSWLDEVLSLPIAHVRKVFKVGDFVIVKVGNDCNRQGWVVEVVEAGDQRQLVVINELATSTVVSGSSVTENFSLF
jgi:transcription elongation factor